MYPLCFVCIGASRAQLKWLPCGFSGRLKKRLDAWIQRLTRGTSTTSFDYLSQPPEDEGTHTLPSSNLSWSKECAVSEAGNVPPRVETVWWLKRYNFPFYHVQYVSTQSGVNGVCYLDMKFPLMECLFCCLSWVAVDLNVLMALKCVFEVVKRGATRLVISRWCIDPSGYFFFLNRMLCVKRAWLHLRNLYFLFIALPIVQVI